MLVFVTGATGALGRHAVRKLIEAGHDVHGVARDQGRAQRLAAAGVTPVALDLTDPVQVRTTIERIQPDAVAHLATHIPLPPAAILPGGWKQNDVLRRDVSRHLVDAALATAVSRYIQESITLIYRDGGTSWLDEDAPLANGPQERTVAASAAQVERVRVAGRAGVLLRFGSFYGPDDAMSTEMARRARAGKPAVPGPAGAYLSPIHVADAASAVVAALDAPPGTYNIVDDEPATRAEFAEVLAHVYGVDRVRLIPAWPLRLSPRTRTVTRSQRVSNRRFRETTGWKPEFPSGAAGWATIAAAGGPAH
ncbi:NAD-dependent epimerase/dehydratase family protein [Candidatus Protofrankia datiscae]|uniref:NAD-dependent epimerase/dehydratase n=1 Tax=Candidatus Protofrankia datiscae TaxID=2716812 RepID=F8B0N2_9ACTN|nr:NAD(P)-dependent oxidoreductase [Candidatus Protofrankia datiscae]AEH10664.1 NAD-dependent epimerase/dehydratase [Candidatus Protofrankia datiscae]